MTAEEKEIESRSGKARKRLGVLVALDLGVGLILVAARGEKVLRAGHYATDHG